MPFNKTLSLTIENYCKRDLPSSEWYNTNFDFIKDSTLKKRMGDFQVLCKSSKANVTV